MEDLHDAEDLIQETFIKAKEILMETNDNVRKIRSRAKQKLMKRLEGES